MHILHDLSVADRYFPGTGFGDRRIVSHHHNGGLEPLMQIPDQAQNLARGVGVQISGRFIGQQNGRG